MAKNRNYTVKHKRRLSGHTDYRARLVLLKSRTPRLVVRRSLGNINVQLVEYHPEGDKVIAGANSRELIPFGWKLRRGNLPAAYLTAYLCALKALKKGAKNFIVDFGLATVTKESRLYAALKGALDAGLEGPHNEKIIPSDEAVNGSRIQAYAELLQKEDKEKYSQQFGDYVKRGVKPEEACKNFEETKGNIKKKWQ